MKTYVLIVQALWLSTIYAKPVLRKLSPPANNSLSYPRPIDLDSFRNDSYTTTHYDMLVQAYENEALSGQINEMFKTSLPRDTVHQYTLSKRDSLTPEKMNYVLDKSAKATIFFKDTNTVLIPDVEDIMFKSIASLKARIKRKGEFKYYECAGVDKAVFKNENLLIPASPCLSFSDSEGQGSGSVSISYQVSLEMNKVGEINEGNTNSHYGGLVKIVTVNIFDIKASKGTSFSGLHKCSTFNNEAVRLFYKPSTVEVILKKRPIVYNRQKSSFFRDEWLNLEKMKFLTTNSPVFICGYESSIDLQCKRPANSFHSDQYKSTIVKSIHSFDDV